MSEELRSGDVLGSSFSSCQLDRMVVVVGAPENAPFGDVRDFMMRGQRYFPHCPMRVYSLRDYPETLLAVPDRAPDYPRINAEQALAFLEDLPDPRLVRRLLIVDGVHPEEPWIRQTAANAELRVGAGVSADGEIRLYRPAIGEDLFPDLVHAWCHLLRARSPAEASLFALAEKLEEFHLADDLMNANPGATVSASERWSSLGRVLLGRDWRGSLYAMVNAIHTCILWRALLRRMRGLPASGPRTWSARQSALMTLIETSVEPAAMKVLRLHSRSGDAVRASAARQIIEALIA